MSLDFADLLLEVIERNASDLHLTAGAHPTVRVRGRLQPLEDYPVMTTEQTRETIYSILTNDQRQRLETDWQIDFAYAIPGRARFRVNAYFQRSAPSGRPSASSPTKITPSTSSALPDGRPRPGQAPARARARHRADRLGQVDVAGRR